MKAWMIYNIDDYKKNNEYYNMHLKIASELGIELELKFMELFYYGVKNGTYYLKYDNIEYNIDKCNLPTFAIARMRNSVFTKQLELMGIDVYNNSIVSDICNDKAKTYQILANKGIKLIDTEYIYKSEYLYKMNNSIDFIFNNVIKSISGHGGNQVYLANQYIDMYNKKALKDTCQDVVVQPLIKGKNQDVRVYILDGEIIGAVIRSANTGFKSNYSLGGKVQKYDVDVKLVNIVNKIISVFRDFEYIRSNSTGLFYVGIDFIVDENGDYLFNEIEDVVGSRMLYNTSSIDIVELYLKKIYSKYTCVE